MLIDEAEILGITEELAPAAPEPAMIYLRQPSLTLGEVIEDLPPNLASWTGSTADIHVSLETETPTIRFGTHEVPSTVKGLEALGVFFDIPTPFLKRVDPDEQQFILDRRIERSTDTMASIGYSTEGGVTEILPASATRLEIDQILSTVADVLPADSLVIEWVNSPEWFLLDTVVPEMLEQYIGGDRRVDDITRGGLRWGQDRKRNLAPWVQPLLYRLRCTNGMEIAAPNLRVEARGKDADEVLDLLRMHGREALDGVAHQIEAFYDLRSQPLGDDRTGVLHRITQEHGLPDRTAVALENALPGYLLADFNISSAEEATMFHLVNLITNGANNPALAESIPSRRRLERIGGTILNEHAARCTFCHSKLN